MNKKEIQRKENVDRTSTKQKYSIRLEGIEYLRHSFARDSCIRWRAHLANYY